MLYFYSNLVGTPPGHPRAPTKGRILGGFPHLDVNRESFPRAKR